jgi:hypothetical protein
VRGQQMLVFGHLADVGGHLALQIFFAVGTGESPAPSHQEK